MIDLHLHTTASDGLLAPDLLVDRAARAGLRVISITDHDTVAGLAEARVAADARGLQLVAGIEITAIAGNRDVHVLGYFVDPDSQPLTEFLRGQRRDRRRRVTEMSERLQSLGYSIDLGTLVERTENSSRSIGRPAIADALVAAGYVADRNEAFARLLGRGCPAFVPRRGVTPERVIQVIHAAGGVASMAHPGVTREDALIPDLVAAGLDAIEVWHSDHTPDDAARYSGIAAQYRLARTGGSDYHGDGVHRACQLGTVELPAAEFAKLAGRAGTR